MASASHALVFAINEGVTYRVTNEEIAAKYAAIAADVGKLLKQPVVIEPVGPYPLQWDGRGPQRSRGHHARFRAGGRRHGQRHRPIAHLLKGFDFLIAVIGLLGIGEILLTMEEGLAFKGKTWPPPGRRTWCCSP